MLSRSLAVLFAIPLLALPARGQAVATVCKDGTTSATSGRGACSGHGGVDKKAAKQSASAAKAEKKATPVVKPTMPAPPAPTRAATTPRAPAAAPSAVHASNTDPTGATAQCKDGTYSHATSHRGACARHQGVAKWL
jgi:hypothetical protein